MLFFSVTCNRKIEKSELRNCMRTYKIELLLGIIAVFTFFIGVKKWYQAKSYGKVIILQGPSTVGKSSIQKEFQQLMLPKLWIKLGIDSLFDAPMPDIIPENMHMWQAENFIRWITRTEDQNKPVVTLHVGRQGSQVVYGMNSAIAAYAKAGCNIIVDYIAYEKAWLDDLKKKLKPMKTYWVKVTAPLELLEQREVARGTSPQGHARSHYDFVYWDMQYDFELDVEKKTPQELAKIVKEKCSL